eukprot:gene14188-20157_t
MQEVKGYPGGGHEPGGECRGRGGAILPAGNRAHALHSSEN